MMSWKITRRIKWGVRSAVGGAVVGIIALFAYIHLPLADDMFSNAPESSLKILDRHGILLRETLSAEGGRATRLAPDELPQKVIRAVVETEDRRFFSHSGVDLLALGRAIRQNIRAGRVISGASTITQQLVKMQVGYPRTLTGKFKEMLLALRVERQFSKYEILAHYVNRVSFANQTIGIEAAAKRYFGKPAYHLSFAESVFLAGLIQAPSRLNPYRHFAAAIQRQQALLEQMHTRKALDDAQYALAGQEVIRVVPPKTNFKAPHFCRMILKRLLQVYAEIPGLQQITRVVTTLDYYLQTQVEEIVSARLTELADYHAANAAVLVLENHTGEILAYVGSQDFFDDSTSGQVNGIIALRQPGSTLKPFTYQLALERAYTPATLLPDIQEYPAAPRSFLVENYDRKFHGPVRLREALACSYNIPAVRVLQRVGVEALYQRLHEFGFESLRETPSFYGPGLTLGNGEVTLLELTRAYSTLARRGLPLADRAILELESAVNVSDASFADKLSALDHLELGAATQTPLKAFAPRVIYLLTDILADRQAAVPAFGENSPLSLPFQTAVKTGTSKDYRDNWTVGFTRDYTVGVWVGNFDGTSMRKVSGITGAGPIYRDVMLALYRYHYPSPLLAHPPAGIVHARICPISGKLVNKDCPHALDEIFLEGTEPEDECRIHQAYWVDARDGLLTKSELPHAVKKVFLHFPSLYRNWAHKMGYAAPPTQYSPYTRVVKQRTLSEESGQLHIVHPNNGDAYAVDPVLRREFQTLRLSAVVPAGMSQITWFLNDTPWREVEAPFQTTWRITPGTHRFYVAGDYQGKEIRSEDITVYIVE